MKRESHRARGPMGRLMIAALLSVVHGCGGVSISSPVDDETKSVGRLPANASVSIAALAGDGLADQASVPSVNRASRILGIAGRVPLIATRGRRRFLVGRIPGGFCLLEKSSTTGAITSVCDTEASVARQGALVLSGADQGDSTFLALLVPDGTSTVTLGSKSPVLPDNNFVLLPIEDVDREAKVIIVRNTARRALRVRDFLPARAVVG